LASTLRNALSASSSRPALSARTPRFEGRLQRLGQILGERSAGGESDRRREREEAGAHLQAQYSGAMVTGLLLLALQASLAAPPQNRRLSRSC
jgi:hypothetical protein